MIDFPGKLPPVEEGHINPYTHLTLPFRAAKAFLTFAQITTFTMGVALFVDAASRGQTAPAILEQETLRLAEWYPAFVASGVAASCRDWVDPIFRRGLLKIRTAELDARGKEVMANYEKLSPEERLYTRDKMLDQRDFATARPHDWRQRRRSRFVVVADVFLDLLLPLPWMLTATNGVVSSARDIVEGTGNFVLRLQHEYAQRQQENSPGQG